MTQQNFGKSLLILVAIAVVAGVALAPAADAAPREGRGGGAQTTNAGSGRQGGAQTNAAGSGRQAGTQVNDSRADARSNNVRSGSVNNVNNVNKNVNVNVQNGGGGCCNNNGWDDDHHPVATMAAIGATAAIIGSMVNQPPSNCVPVNYGGMVYQQCGSTWYQPQGSQYVVVNPPY
jgi:hypothetical protein